MNTDRIIKILISVGTILISLGKVIREITTKEDTTSGKPKKIKK